MQFIKRFRVGQRAIKTAVSVGLALALAMVLGSSLPIFAAIGAISVMSRTWVDSLKESLNQIAGTFLGYLIACVFVTVLPNPTFFVWMALGVLCVISLCIGLKLNFAIPGVAAPSAWYMALNFYLRETLALLRYFLFGIV